MTGLVRFNVKWGGVSGTVTMGETRWQATDSIIEGELNMRFPLPERQYLPVEQRAEPAMTWLQMQGAVITALHVLVDDDAEEGEVH